MEHKRYNLILLVLFIALTIVGSIGGIGAVWNYALASTDSDISIDLFPWYDLPSNIDGTKNEDALDKIFNGNSGINTPDSALNNAIKNRQDLNEDTLSNKDVTLGYEVNEALGLDKDINVLISFPDDYTRYIYTTSVKLAHDDTIMGSGVNTIPASEYVYVVYRSVARWNSTTGEWVHESTEAGYAKSAMYSSQIFGGLFSIDTPSIDPSTWTAGRLGGNKKDAIYTYSGQYVVAGLSSDVTHAYYKVKSSGNGTMSITLDEGCSDADIKVFQGKDAVNVTESMANNKRVISWKATRGATYTYKVSNTITTTFTIQ